MRNGAPACTATSFCIVDVGSKLCDLWPRMHDLLLQKSTEGWPGPKGGPGRLALAWQADLGLVGWPWPGRLALTWQAGLGQAGWPLDQKFRKVQKVAKVARPDRKFINIYIYIYIYIV